MELEKNVSLQHLHTFHSPVRTRYFLKVASLEELHAALEMYQDLCKKEPDLPLLILGGGSNVVFSGDYKGLTIALGLKGIAVEHTTEEQVLLRVQAGEVWQDLVEYTLRHNWGGLENLSLIPGNVGTSPMQNIGAYGVEIKDVFERCTVLDLRTREIKTLTNSQCEFGYRESIFKRKAKGQYIILEVFFCLTRRNHPLKISYGAIASELEAMGVVTPTIQQVAQAVVRIRKSKLPDPNILGNAGSFFKNPTVESNVFSALTRQFPTIPSYPQPQGVKIPAGWLIEQCGWKGRRIGNVACHHLQALVLVNATGAATGEEIYAFSQEIIDSVESKFGITLEREVNIITS